jgi:hypothetical protein
VWEFIFFAVFAHRREKAVFRTVAFFFLQYQWKSRLNYLPTEKILIRKTKLAASSDKMLRFASSAGPKSALVVGSMGQLGYDGAVTPHRASSSRPCLSFLPLLTRPAPAPPWLVFVHGPTARKSWPALAKPAGTRLDLMPGTARLTRSLAG